MYDDIKNALEVLRNGGVILYPTDTIWGLGCDATNSEAVARIYRIKKRLESKNMLILMENVNLIERYVEEVPEVAYDLIELSEKPVTIIYDRARNLAANLIAADGSIGIRITSEAFSRQLIRQFKKPVVSSSANISGQAFPRNFSEIAKEIIDAADYVVQYRKEEKTFSEASSIIKLGPSGQVKIIRP